MAIAVVIPLYNHERFIAEALRSVLAQTRRVDKIVVVDDGSSDASVEEVRKFDDNRIELITQENAGAHAALNHGIAIAAEQCEFITILNSDDVYGPKRIEKCGSFLEQNPGVEIVCTRLRMIDENGAFLDVNDPKARWIERLWNARREHPVEWLGIANFAKTSSNFVARARFLRAHPFRAYRYVHDYFLVLLAALENKLGVIDEELLRYRAHPTNTIKSGPLENVTRELLVMNIDLLRDLEPLLAKDELLRANYTRYFRVLCQNYVDFRAEVFFPIIAKTLHEQTNGSLAKVLSSLIGGQFPELGAPKSDRLKHELAQLEYEALLRQIAGSRWLGLGRVFGSKINVWRDAPDATKRLSLLKKSCAESRWFRLGQRLGFVYSDV